MPWISILTVLKRYAGQSIVVRVYRKGRVVRNLRDNGQMRVIRDGSGNSTGEQALTFFQEAYDVPATNGEINSAFKGRHFEGWEWDWKTGSMGDEGLHLEIGDEIRVFPAVHVLPRRRHQRFASGVTHCVFTPMREWAQNLLTPFAAKEEEAREKGKRVPQAVRKGVSRYRGYIRVLDKYEAKYSDGVPEEAFQDLANDLGGGGLAHHR